MPLPIPIPKSVAPTDNLYKFLALFGLALVVVAFVVQSMDNRQYNDKVMLNYINDAVSAAASSQPSLSDSNSALLADRVKAHAELAAAKALLTAETRDFGILSGVGAVLSLVGFVGWYWYVQRHHDSLLVARVEKELASLEKRPRAVDNENVGTEQDDDG